MLLFLVQAFNINAFVTFLHCVILFMIMGSYVLTVVLDVCSLSCVTTCIRLDPSYIHSVEYVRLCGSERKGVVHHAPVDVLFQYLGLLDWRVCPDMSYFSISSSEYQMPLNSKSKITCIYMHMYVVLSFCVYAIPCTFIWSPLYRYMWQQRPFPMTPVFIRLENSEPS